MNTKTKYSLGFIKLKVQLLFNSLFHPRDHSSATWGLLIKTVALHTHKYIQVQITSS